MPKTVPIFIANWKMNSRLVESMQYIKKFRRYMLNNLVGSEVVICPPATLLRDMAEKVPGTGVRLGGQDCYHEEKGAFTGDISAQMLKDMTCEYVILGHSERRKYHNEDNKLIAKKAETAHGCKLKTIICVGETKEERKNKKAKEVVKKQLLGSIPKSATGKNLIIAYEPVWAIGTNTTPTPEEIGDMHLYIHKILKSHTNAFEKTVRVVYGGSVNVENAGGILDAEGVNGLLIGRASEDVEAFWRIIQYIG